MRSVFMIVALMFTCPALSADRPLILASTTSTQNSGLYDHLLPYFEAETGIEVRVIAVGTGQALRIARNGDADILIVHHRPSEDAFVADGFGVERFDVMYNDFVIVGPNDDPADIRGADGILGAMTQIAATQPPFISRGDDSGTHKRERDLWISAGLEPTGDWYRDIGSGMGAALNMAAAINGYTLSDRGTWLSFGNKQDMDLLFSGGRDLRNPYSVIAVNPEKHPHILVKEANQLVDWLLSEHGQSLIGAFQVENKQLFCPFSRAEEMSESDLVTCPAD